MSTITAFSQHLTSSDDLITPSWAIQAYAAAEALEIERRARPFVERAHALQVLAAQYKTPAQLLHAKHLQAALALASGISDQQFADLAQAERSEIIRGFVKNFLEPAGANFVEELVYRFLLTRGDTLGGSMRNVGGALAQRKLTRALIATLTNAGRPYHWQPTSQTGWLPMTKNDADIELRLRGLSWQKGNQWRTLIYNLTVPLVKNNVDLCLFKGRPADITKEAFESLHLYLALGELKGGIDPAGADEHWKTARAALNRIRTAFANQNYAPQMFFIGAAIEKKMANEIWSELQDGTLSNAANLTDDQQITYVSHWLCNL